MEEEKVKISIEKAVDKLIKNKEIKTSEVELEINSKKVKLAFMIEQGNMWFLSKSDRTKMRYEDIETYLNSL